LQTPENSLGTVCPECIHVLPTGPALVTGAATVLGSRFDGQRV
jgi:hypothetical protein